MSDSTPPPASPYAPIQPMSPSDEKLWATLIHVGGIFFWFIPALVGYLVLKDRGPFVQAHARTALNFQITASIAYVISLFLMLILIGYIMYFGVAILVLIFSIMGAVAANNGQAYKYPLTIEFIK
ncbi:DUF4870 domain-containing protein [Rhodoglobus sp. NPDC076762]